MNEDIPDSGPGSPRVTIQRDCADQLSHELPEDETVRHVVSAALPAGAEVTVRFVSMEESQATNLRFRAKDRPTNVLSFAYPGENLAGDIAICPAIVEQEAASAGLSPWQRYAHLLVHAALHLQGMTHDQPANASKMEAAETKIMRGLGLADPYASGA